MMPRRTNRIEISLFPFLSVLCAVIGVLVLFIVLVLSTRVVVQEEYFQRREEHTRQPRVGRPDAMEEGIDAATFETLQEELERLSDQLKARQRERDELTETLRGLEDLIETRKTELLLPRGHLRPQEFDRPEPVAVVPDADYEVSLRPNLIEVSVDGYTLHPSRAHFPPFEVDESSEPGAGANPCSEMAAYLQETDRRRAREYLVLLVHPNGVEGFFALRSYLAREHPDLNLGWEPFSRQWILASESEP